MTWENVSSIFHLFLVKVCFKYVSKDMMLFSGLVLC